MTSARGFVLWKLDIIFDVLTITRILKNVKSRFCKNMNLRYKKHKVLFSKKSETLDVATSSAVHCPPNFS